MSIPNGIASEELANTKLPLYDHSDAAIYLRQFVLNCQMAVKANDIKRRRMLKAVLHQLVAEQFGEQIECLVDEAAEQLYERLMKEGS